MITIELEGHSSSRNNESVDCRPVCVL